MLARWAPSLVIVLSLSLVHAHGTGFQWTFNLVILSNFLNVNSNDYYFVLPMVAYSACRRCKRPCNGFSSCYGAIEIVIIIIIIIIIIINC